jgi:hypothetical protein
VSSKNGRYVTFSRPDQHLPPKSEPEDGFNSINPKSNSPRKVMRAAYMPEQGKLAVGDFPVPVTVKDGDVVVKIEFASICGSDTHNVYDGF